MTRAFEFPPLVSQFGSRSGQRVQRSSQFGCVRLLPFQRLLGRAQLLLFQHQVNALKREPARHGEDRQQ